MDGGGVQKRRGPCEVGGHVGVAAVRSSEQRPLSGHQCRARVPLYTVFEGRGFDDWFPVII